MDALSVIGALSSMSSAGTFPKFTIYQPVVTVRDTPPVETPISMHAVYILQIQRYNAPHMVYEIIGSESTMSYLCVNALQTGITSPQAIELGEIVIEVIGSAVIIKTESSWSGTVILPNGLIGVD